MTRAAISLVLVVATAGFLAVGARTLLEDKGRGHLRAGQKHLAAGRFGEAAKTFGRVLGDPARSDVVLEARLLKARAILLGVRKGVFGPRTANEVVGLARQLLEALPPDHHGRGRTIGTLSEGLEALGKTAEAVGLLAEEAARTLGEGHRARVAGYYVTLAEAALAGRPSEDPLVPGVKPDPAAAADLYERALDALTDGKPHAPLSLPRARALLDAGDKDKIVVELTRLLEKKSLPEAVRAEALYLRGKAHVAAQRWNRAQDDLGALLALPSVEETSFAADGLLMLAASHQGGGSATDLAEAVTTWRRFLERHPDHAKASEVRALIAESWFRADQLKPSLDAWADVLADAKAPKELKARARTRTARCLERQQRFDAAREAWRAFLAQHPDHSAVPTAQERLGALLLEKASSLRKRKSPDEAIASMRQYLEEYPLGGSAAKVALEIGQVLRAEKRYADAARAFEAAQRRYREHERATAAQAGYLRAVVTEENLDDLELAARTYKKITEDFKGTPAAASARRRLTAMEAVELEVAVPRMYAPGEAANLAVTVRNLSEVTLRVYRLDAREIFEQRGRLEAAADIEVALVKADKSRSWSVPGYRRYRRGRHEVAITLEDGRPLPDGAYLVSAEAEERRSVVLLLVSPIRLVVKTSPNEVFCWAVDAKTGAPRADVDVLVRGQDSSGDLSEDLKTGKDGVARYASKTALGPVRVLAMAGEAATPGRAPKPPAAVTTGLVPRVSFMLDRPIYRPGSDVAFRAILRDVRAGDFVTPSEGKVVARLRDPKGWIVGRSELEIGRFGTVHGRFMAPGEGPLGDHRLEIDFAKQVHSETVPVEAYRKPEFLVGVKPLEVVRRPGADIDVELDVSYYFGGRVKGAVYEWRVWRAPAKIDRERYKSHAWFLRAVRQDRERKNPGREYRFVASGGGTTDEDGRGRFGFPSERRSGDQRYLIQVSVRDTSGEFVVGSASAWTGQADRFGVVLADRRSYRAGDTVEARVVTALLSQRPIGTRGRLVALREKKSASGESGWDEVAEAAVDTGLEGEARVRLLLAEAGDHRLRFEGLDGNGHPVQAETRVLVTGEKHDLEKEARLRFEREAYRGGDTARLHLSLPRPGRPALLTFEGERVLSYRILNPRARSEVHEIVLSPELAPNVTAAIAAPDGDRLLTSSDSVVVLRYLKIGLEPEREEVAPGSEVAVAVETLDQRDRPVAASVALRAFDGALADLGGNAGQDPRYVFNRDLRRHLVRTGSSFEFDFSGRTVSLDPDLLLLKEAERMKEQIKRLSADNDALSDAKFESAIEMDEEEPAEEVNEAVGLGGGAGGAFGGRRGGKRSLRSYGGPARKSASPAPAMDPSSQVALGFAFDSNADSISDKVMADINFRGRAEGVFKNKAVFANEPSFYRMPVAAAALDLPMVAPTLRKNFLEVAGWWPDIETDAKGRGRVTLKLPDNLTTWSLSAAGADRGLSVGRGAARVSTRKSVITRLATPRFLTSRDEIGLRASVHSNLEKAADFRLELESRDAALLGLDGMTEASFRLEPGASETRTIKARAAGAGVPVLRARGLSSVASDALETAFPVVAFGEPALDVRRGELRDRLRFEVSMDGDLVAGSARYFVVVDADCMAEILSGLNFLAGYPYGCLEQSVNRWFPMMMFSQALDAAGRPSPVDPVRLRALVEDGITRLVAFQNDDGSFGYWPGSAGHPFATAMVLEALVQARAFGYRVDARLMQRARNGAQVMLNAHAAASSADARAALVLALVRAGRTPRNDIARLVRERRALGTAGLARLLLACKASGRADALETLARELDGRKVDAALPYPARSRRPWSRCDLSSTALVLMARQAMNAPASKTRALVASIRKGLQRRHGSTKGVALAVESLIGEVTGERALRAAGNLKVLVDGKEVARSTLGRDRPSALLEIPAAMLPAGKHVVEVAKEGGATASCRLVLRHVRPREVVEPAGNLLKVRRRVTAWQDPDQPKAEWRPGFGVVAEEVRPRPVAPPTLTQAVSGWRVTVELEVEAREALSYLAIEDPQFAGLEVIESGVRGKVDRFERRDGKLVFFKNALAAGEVLRITYPCYVVREGRFHALPAAAQEMYAPENHGRSGSAVLEIVPDVAMLARIAPREATPDELMGRLRQAWGKEAWKTVTDTATKLLAGLPLVDAVHDEVLAKATVAALRLEQWPLAIKSWDELSQRNAKKARLSVADRERLGRGLLASGDAERAREQFQTVLIDAFEDERDVTDAYLNAQREMEAATLSARLCWRYPALGEILAHRVNVAENYLDIPDRSLGKSAELLPEAHRVLWRDAMDHLLGVMAWSPGSELAEEAAYDRISILGRLGLLERVVAECQGYRKIFTASMRADDIAWFLARAAFGLARYDEASESVKEVWEKRWRRGERKDQVERSRHRHRAGHLLGKIAHVRGDYPRAVAWYGRVRKQVPDALQSWRFFTRKSLACDPVVTLDPTAEPRLEFRAKNLETVRCAVYPVDLSVLFAVKKSFDKLNSAELAGIRPAREQKVECRLSGHDEQTVAADLGRLDPGAYLVVLRADDRAATSLVLVTEARLVVQREGRRLRVYLTDGAGKPVAGARLKLGQGGRIADGGVTDVRGMFTFDSVGRGRITLVAEKDGLVAVATAP